MKNIVRALRRLNPKVEIAIQAENNTKPGEKENSCHKPQSAALNMIWPRQCNWDIYRLLRYGARKKKRQVAVYMTADGMHPNDLGDQDITNILEKYLE